MTNVLSQDRHPISHATEIADMFKDLSRDVGDFSKDFKEYIEEQKQFLTEDAEQCEADIAQYQAEVDEYVFPRFACEGASKPFSS